MIRLGIAEDHTIVRWALREALAKVSDIEVVGDRLLDAVLHARRQRVDRLLPAGQVDEHELRVVRRPDTSDPVPGRMRNTGDDRDLLAGERVDERRLADIRTAGDGDETGPQGSSHVSGRSSLGVVVRISPLGRR